jgi:hypothetical protein
VINIQSSKAYRRIKTRKLEYRGKPEKSLNFFYSPSLLPSPTKDIIGFILYPVGGTPTGGQRGLSDF